MGVKVKKVIKVIAFLCVVIFLLMCVVNMFKFTYSDGIRQMETFYRQEKETIDVLILGSSHAFLNIYTEVLWKEYGLSSFNLSASVQPLWSSYHYLVEALKTQTPDVIVLEGYRLAETDDYMNKSTTIKNLYGMKFSKNKLDAIRASIPQDKELAEELGLTDVEYELFNYHSRYRELSLGDVLPYYGEPYEKFAKGSICGGSVYPDHETPDVRNFSQEKIPLSVKTEEYYRKILDIGKEYDIPVVTVIAPFNTFQEYYSAYLSAKDIAEEYGQPFIDYNNHYEELELNFKTDILDISGHLNKSGAEKFTSALGEYLTSNYELTDHRGDEKYSSWEDNAEAYYRLHDNGGLADISTPKEYVEHATSKGNYEFIFTLNGIEDADDAFKDEVISMFSSLNIEITESLRDGVWIYDGKKLKYENHNAENFKKGYRFDRYNDALVMWGNPADPNSENRYFYVISDDNAVLQMEQGLMIYTYDTMISVNTHTMFYGFE